VDSLGRIFWFGKMAKALARASGVRFHGLIYLAVDWPADQNMPEAGKSAHPPTIIYFSEIGGALNFSFLFYSINCTTGTFYCR